MKDKLKKLDEFYEKHERAILNVTAGISLATSCYLIKQNRNLRVENLDVSKFATNVALTAIDAGIATRIVHEDGKNSLQFHYDKG
jgi:hypothetical protein